MPTKSSAKSPSHDGDTNHIQNIEGPNWEWEMQLVHIAIERRAYELFETRGCEHGHDWEDWFRAESELDLNE